MEKNIIDSINEVTIEFESGKSYGSDNLRIYESDKVTKPGNPAMFQKESTTKYSEVTPGIWRGLTNWKGSQFETASPLVELKFETPELFKEWSSNDLSGISIKRWRATTDGIYLQLGTVNPSCTELQLAAINEQRQQFLDKVLIALS